MPFLDKEKQSASSKKHYEANKTEIIKRALLKKKADRLRNKLFVQAYLSEHPCIDCGESDTIVLEFDHVRGSKEANVSDGAVNAWSLKRLKEEIDKCDVRCANCHRRITFYRREYKIAG